jgi:putative transposase
MRLKNILKDLQARFAAVPNNDPRAKVGTGSLIAVLVFFFRRDRHSRTLESLRKLVQEQFKTNLSRGGFWERLAARKLRDTLETLVCSMVQAISHRLSVSDELLKVLGVSSILLLDSSSSTLPKSAKTLFPAPRNNVAPASVKLHLCFDIIKGAVDWFNITEATSHDRNSFPDVKSLKGKLIIFDLGYWDYYLLAQIIAVGGFFLSRVKSSACIDVIKVIEGLPKHFEGWGDLFDRKFPDRHSKIIEIIGGFSQNYKPIFEARVIGFWNPIAKQYHWYVTNLAAPAKLIYPLYRLRWQIELIFKSLKATFRLADFSTANPNIIHVLLFAALIATIVAHPIAFILAEEHKASMDATPSFQRAAMVISGCARLFINFLLSKRKSDLMLLIRELKRQTSELFDPNYRKRKSSLMLAIRLAESLV